MNFPWFRNFLPLSTLSKPHLRSPIQDNPLCTFQNTPAVCKPNLVFSEITTGEEFSLLLPVLPRPCFPSRALEANVSIGGRFVQHSKALSLSLSLSALFYDRCQARRTTRERSCAEVAKNSDVERAAADEEAARVITFPVITRCRLAIYFPPPPLSYPLVHAPPLYSPSGFTYSSLVVFGSTFPSRFASSVENLSFFFFSFTLSFSSTFLTFFLSTKV